MNKLGLGGHVAGVFHGVGRVDHVHLQQRQKGSLNVPERQTCRLGPDMSSATQSVPYIGAAESTRKGQKKNNNSNKHLETAVTI